VTGSATGLYPGAGRPLALTFTNPNNQAVNVTGFTVTPTAASSQCPASLVTATGFTPMTIAKNSSATQTMTLHLAPTATNACRNKTWGLTYSGTAAQA
jgi:hypothetical protein